MNWWFKQIYYIQAAVTLCMAACVFYSESFAQNPLYIPDTLSGTTFNLNVQAGTKIFFAGKNTPTYGYNGNFLGPTLLINKGDLINLNVTNALNVATTVHWHGFHVAPENDGGPHQPIAPNGGTWSPSFKMRNDAATYWYHPHGEGKTEMQINKGLAGVIIVRDSIESTLTLPRKYGIDDFPLIVQSKAFDVLKQLAIASHEDSVMMVNGTIDPYLQVPKQVVRLRLLNASADRTYYFGLSDNSNFYLIASDGGLLSASHITNRVRLSTGERVEILVDFNQYTVGQQLYLKSYASELPKGIIGADSVGTKTILMGEGYYENPLNGADFNILRFDVSTAAANPVTTIPSTLVSRTPLSFPVDANRTIEFTPDTVMSGQQGFVDGPFFMNKQSFHMDSVNIITYLNNKEIWTLINKTLVAHPFHIHDVQFYVLDINGNPPPPEYSGLKDVILVKPNETVRFITKFEDFANSMVPYMYHCHLLHHEDEGMMGTFLVLDTTGVGIKQIDKEANQVTISPNPTASLLNIKLPNSGQSEDVAISIFDLQGRLLLSKNINKQSDVQVNTEELNNGIYLLRITEKNIKREITRKLIIHH